MTLINNVQRKTKIIKQTGQLGLQAGYRVTHAVNRHQREEIAVSEGGVGASGQPVHSGSQEEQESIMCTKYRRDKGVFRTLPAIARDLFTDICKLRTALYKEPERWFGS